MGGGTSRTQDTIADDTETDESVAALVAHIKRNERNVFEIPFQITMVNGKMDGKTLTVPCPPTDCVSKFKQRIAEITGDVSGDLALSYGEGDKHEGKLFFIELKGPKAFDFDEEKVAIQDCRCTQKNDKFKCNASKDINLDAYSNENLHMLGQSCRQALRKPMQVYMSAYKSAVNQWVEEAGLPDKNEEDGGPKVPYETFHREAVKNATLIYTDPRKHKTWSHKFKSIEADTEEELTAKSNAMFHRQARAQVDSFLSVFTFRVEKALAAFPPHIVGHMDLVWDRLNEVIDKRIDEIIDEHKAKMFTHQKSRIKNAIYANLWFDEDVEEMAK